MPPQYQPPINPYQGQHQPKKPPLKAIILLIGLVGFMILIINLLQYSFIVIELQSNQDSNTTYSFTNLASGDTKTEQTNQPKVRKLLKRGNYQVDIQQSNHHSYFTTAQATGLFRTTRLEVAPQIEKQREFIGDNPHPCLDYVDNLLVSWPCLSSIELGSVHEPASRQSPSVNRRIQSRTRSGPIGYGIIPTNPSYLLTENFFDGGDQLSLMPFNPKTGQVNDVAGRSLASLETGSNYQITQYGDEFIVASENSVVRLNKSLATNEIEMADQDQTHPIHTVQSWGDSLMIVNSNLQSIESDGTMFTPSFIPEDESLDHQDTTHEQGFVATVDGSSEPHSSITIISNDQTITVNTTSQFSHIRLCGPNLICTLSNDQLTINELSDQQLKPVFSLRGVMQIEVLAENLLIVNRFGVLQLNPSTQQGHYDYTFGNYEFCGLQIFSNQEYGLCISNHIDANRPQSMLLITPSDLTHPIDQQVYKLLESSSVVSLSVYRQFIHVASNYGDLVPDEETGLFDYDPAMISHTNQVIASIVEDIGIDQEKYSIITPVN